MKTINGWTKAKMIDHIKNNFRGKSVIGDTCAYRGKNGKKCAVGLFIPDSKYSSRMERPDKSSASFVIPNYHLSGDMPLELQGMEILQNIHDKSLEEDTLFNLLEWIEKAVEDSEVTV